LAEDNIGTIRTAVNNGSSMDGLPLKFHLIDPNDRLRLWLPDRLEPARNRSTCWDPTAIGDVADEASTEDD
jgi:hypothetical protein